jgi:hypothetical protein
MSKTLMVLVAVALMLVLVFGSQLESDNREPVRFCVLWLTIPILALGGVSITLRPVFSPRYIAPAAPALALLTARALEIFGGRVRNLSTAGIVTAFTVLFFFCRAGRYEPWRDIARQVAAGGSAQPVFFESPLEAQGIRNRAEGDEEFDTDFPTGYFKVPFDYYFKGPNSRRVINPFDAARARQEIGDAVVEVGGAWLVSGSNELNTRKEIPESAHFRTRRVLQARDVSLYHLVILPQ